MRILVFLIFRNEYLEIFLQVPADPFISRSGDRKHDCICFFMNYPPHIILFVSALASWLKNVKRHKGTLFVDSKGSTILLHICQKVKKKKKTKLNV